MCYSGTCYFEDYMGNCELYGKSFDSVLCKYGIHPCTLGGFMNNEVGISVDAQKYAKKRLEDYIRDKKELKHREVCLRQLHSISEELAEKGLKDGT